ncbi:MAG: hypothetical protein EBU61_01740 [Crocinitomicaceae bacterium]|nr:hypothetical protein [Crocinitomicaceae bacterium]
MTIKCWSLDSPAPITLGATNYFAWGAPAPVITSVAPLVVCAFNDMITITGTGLSGVTAVSIGGTPVTAFTVVSPTSITCYSAAGTSGVIGVTKFGAVTYGTDVITINSGPASPVLSTTAVSAQFGQAITVSVNNPVMQVLLQLLTLFILLLLVIIYMFLLVLELVKVKEQLLLFLLHTLRLFLQKKFSVVLVVVYLYRQPL